jgi:WD40 repeat protein
MMKASGVFSIVFSWSVLAFAGPAQASGGLCSLLFVSGSASAPTVVSVSEAARDDVPLLRYRSSDGKSELLALSASRVAVKNRETDQVYPIEGHFHNVLWAELSADGKKALILSYGYAKTSEPLGYFHPINTLIDVATGKEIKSLLSTSSSAGYHLSPDGELFLSNRSHYEVIEIKSGQKLWGASSQLAQFSPDKETLLDKGILLQRVRNVKTGAVLASFRQGGLGHFTPEGDRIWFASGGVAVERETRTGKITQKLKLAGRADDRGILFSGNGSIMAVPFQALSGEQATMIVNRMNGETHVVKGGHLSVISEDGKLVAFSARSYAKVYDTQSGKLIYEFVPPMYHQNRIERILFVSNDQMIIARANTKVVVNFGFPSSDE